MKLIQSKVRYTVNGIHEPHTVILHHTAGGLKGSESYLRQKGLGYHFMIAKDGTVYAYNPVDEVVSHASRANYGYVGVSYESGGTLGPTNELQLQASIELLTKLASDHDSITKVSDHASIDKIVAKRGWKSDPFWPGEKSEVNNWKIKHKYIDLISSKTGLVAVKYDPTYSNQKAAKSLLHSRYEEDNNDDDSGGCCE